MVVARTNVYQVPPKAAKISQKLLPTARTAAKATAKAEQPKGQDPPTWKRDGCENPTWNGKAVFYCSIARKGEDNAPKECEAPGCTNAKHEGSPFCSLDCMGKVWAAKAETGEGKPIPGEPVKGPVLFRQTLLAKAWRLLPLNQRTCQKRFRICLLIRARSDITLSLV